MGKIVIIGNGVSGITTARHVRKKSDDEILVISAETPYFFSRTALMYVYMGHMKFEHTQPYEDWFWAKNRIDLLQAYVKEIDYATKVLKTSSGKSITYDKLVLAVGSKPNKFGWPGQDLKGVQGLYSAQDLKTLEENTDPYGKPQRVKRAVIVGGGLIGIELAEMLMSRGIPVTFLVRESHFWGNVLPKEESELVMRHMREHHIDLRTSTEMAEVLADENGRARAVVTKEGEEISCELVGLTAGVSPNIDFLKESGIACERGIMVNEFLETSQPDVYALGDCAQFKESINGRRTLEQVWYTGRMMGETLAHTLTGKRTAYLPGHWFNSAKFLDIEYQTYGWVFAKPREEEAHYYWEHPEGKISLRINYHQGSGLFIGMNVFGIRIRHEVIDRWLTEGQSMDYVVSHLRNANFDPEFYRKYEGSIVKHYNNAFQKELKSARKSLKEIFSL